MYPSTHKQDLKPIVSVRCVMKEYFIAPAHRFYLHIELVKYNFLELID